MIIASFSKAIGQLPEPEFRGVLLKSVAMAFVTFAILIGVIIYLLSGFDYFDWDWVDSLVQWAGGIGSVFLALLLFPALSGIFISLFLDQIAATVERTHYPNDPPGTGLGVKESLTLALKFAGVMLLLNLLALPLYLILLFLPPLNLVLFYVLNGYLLAREYFELVGGRHLGIKDLAKARKKIIWTIFPAGIITAFALTIPIVNLVAPIVATAAMVHIFKSLERRGDIAPDPI